MKSPYELDSFVTAILKNVFILRDKQRKSNGSSEIGRSLMEKAVRQAVSDQAGSAHRVNELIALRSAMKGDILYGILRVNRENKLVSAEALDGNLEPLPWVSRSIDDSGDLKKFRKKIEKIAIEHGQKVLWKVLPENSKLDSSDFLPSNYGSYPVSFRWGSLSFQAPGKEGNLSFGRPFNIRSATSSVLCVQVVLPPKGFIPVTIDVVCSYGSSPLFTEKSPLKVNLLERMHESPEKTWAEVLVEELFCNQYGSMVKQLNTIVKYDAEAFAKQVEPYSEEEDKYDSSLLSGGIPLIESTEVVLDGTKNVISSVNLILGSIDNTNYQEWQESFSFGERAAGQDEPVYRIQRDRKIENLLRRYRKGDVPEVPLVSSHFNLANSKQEPWVQLANLVEDNAQLPSTKLRHFG